MIAVEMIAPPPTAENARALAADLETIGVSKRIAARLARDAVFSKDSQFFRAAHVIAHAGARVDHNRIINVLKAHGLLPRRKARA